MTKSKTENRALTFKEADFVNDFNNYDGIFYMLEASANPELGTPITAKNFTSNLDAFDATKREAILTLLDSNHTLNIETDLGDQFVHDLVRYIVDPSKISKKDDAQYMESIQQVHNRLLKNPDDVDNKIPTGTNALIAQVFQSALRETPVQPPAPEMPKTPASKPMWQIAAEALEKGRLEREALKNQRHTAQSTAPIETQTTSSSDTAPEKTATSAPIADTQGPIYYRHANKPRKHSQPVKALGETIEGDELKTQILKEFRAELETQKNDLKYPDFMLKEYIEDFKQSNNYKILEAKQGQFSPKGLVDNGAVIAFRKICNDFVPEKKEVSEKTIMTRARSASTTVSEKAKDATTAVAGRARSASSVVTEKTKDATVAFSDRARSVTKSLSEKAKTATKALDEWVKNNPIKSFSEFKKNFKNTCEGGKKSEEEQKDTSNKNKISGPGN